MGYLTSSTLPHSHPPWRTGSLQIWSSLISSFLPKREWKSFKNSPPTARTAILSCWKNCCLKVSACSAFSPPTHLPRFCRLSWGNWKGTFRMFHLCSWRLRSPRRAPNFPLQIKYSASCLAEKRLCFGDRNEPPTIVGGVFCRLVCSGVKRSWVPN